MQDPDGGASTTWETQGIQANGAAQRLTVDGGSAGIRMAARQFGGAFLPAVLKDGHRVSAYAHADQGRSCVK